MGSHCTELPRSLWPGCINDGPTCQWPLHPMCITLNNIKYNNYINNCILYKKRGDGCLVKGLERYIKSFIEVITIVDLIRTHMTNREEC